MSVEHQRYERIGPTLILIAYLRTFSDIPLSTEIFQEINSTIDYSQYNRLAPRYEARYKLIDRMIASSGLSQIFEIASGFSPRGILATRERSVRYVELDLPNQANGKRKLVRRLNQKYGIPLSSNNSIVEGNALDVNDLNSGVNLLEPGQPIAIINEGLMRYFSMDEKAILAKNIHAILQTRGGVWITPDITLTDMGGKGNKLMNALAYKVSGISGIEVSNNTFESKENARDFFSKLGFDIE